MWTVGEIMQKQVVTVPPEMPVRELVQLLARNRISGAPVVGSAGEILGVVSATDVVALAAYGADAETHEPFGDEEGAADEESASYFRSPEGPLDFEAHHNGIGEYLVKDIMTPAAFSVKPTDTCGELARFLLRGHIHRALVVDQGKLVGIATTFDVLQAVASTAEVPDGSELAVTGADRG